MGGIEGPTFSSEHIPDTNLLPGVDDVPFTLAWSEESQSYAVLDAEIYMRVGVVGGRINASVSDPHLDVFISLRGRPGSGSFEVGLTLRDDILKNVFSDPGTAGGTISLNPGTGEIFITTYLATGRYGWTSMTYYYSSSGELIDIYSTAIHPNVAQELDTRGDAAYDFGFDARNVFRSDSDRPGLNLLDVLFPTQVAGYLLADGRYYQEFSNGRVTSLNYESWVAHTIEGLGGWTPPSGTRIEPLGGGFKIVNNDGSPWEPGPPRDYSLDGAYDEDGEGTRD